MTLRMNRGPCGWCKELVFTTQPRYDDREVSGFYSHLNCYYKWEVEQGTKAAESDSTPTSPAAAVAAPEPESAPLSPKYIPRKVMPRRQKQAQVGLNGLADGQEGKVIVEIHLKPWIAEYAMISSAPDCWLCGAQLAVASSPVVCTVDHRSWCAVLLLGTLLLPPPLLGISSGSA